MVVTDEIEVSVIVVGTSSVVVRTRVVVGLVTVSHVCVFVMTVFVIVLGARLRGS